MNRRTEDKKAGLTEQEHFLDRWSRRKQAVQQKSELVAESETEQELSGASENFGVDENAQHALPPLTDADMPGLKDLDGDSDYAEFFSPGVSEKLRRMALRQLFHSAQFNICDGLDDYDEDFTSFEKLGDIVTADMRHRLDIENQKEEAESALLEPKPEDDADPSADEPGQEDAAIEPEDKEMEADESPRLGENDNEIDTQPDSAPGLIERSSS